LDRFLGMTSWRKRWYGPRAQSDLFGDEIEIEKTATIAEIENDFHTALKTAFPRVAENRKQLRNNRGTVLFTLMFACSNPSSKAHDLAVKIANHLLKS
ncbi:MAG: hypothetical protein ACLFWF_13020, partial [Alphaproteobacteria bacterium]